MTERKRKKRACSIFETIPMDTLTIHNIESYLFYYEVANIVQTSQTLKDRFQKSKYVLQRTNCLKLVKQDVSNKNVSLLEILNILQCIKAWYYNDNLNWLIEKTFTIHSLVISHPIHKERVLTIFGTRESSLFIYNNEFLKKLNDIIGLPEMQKFDQWIVDVTFFGICGNFDQFKYYKFQYFESDFQNQHLNKMFFNHTRKNNDRIDISCRFSSK
jgi:hypothetical protein